MNVSEQPRCLVFGATGRTGRLLLRHFSEQGFRVVAVGRNKEKLSALGGDCVQVQCDFDDPSINLENGPIKSGDVVVLSAGVRFVPKIISICPPDIKRLVVLGTARHLSKYPGDTGLAMREAMKLLAETDLNWVLLAPTMIYGAAGENNVKRMAKLISRFGVVPLPGGGKNLLQPIHTSDVVKATVIAASIDGVVGKVIHIAGPEPVTNKKFLEEIATAIGKRLIVIALPKWLMLTLAFITRFIPGVPTISADEVERLLEDRSVDASDMKNILGLKPRPLKEGLAETFAARH